MGRHSSDESPSRRDFLRMAGVGLGAAALGLGAADLAAVSQASPLSPSAAGPSGATGPYNILFILVDQERYFRSGELPSGYRLPGHERLAQRGIVFDNHRINSCVCTPSRSVLYTGRHIQQTKMFDNTNFPWISSLSPELPTLGSMLRQADYYTAYKGKWHLSKDFETVNDLDAPTKIFTKEMEAYGFSDYFGIGDIIAHERGGYRFDGVIAAMAISWLREKGLELAQQHKPWFLAVNLVNPHDVMFLNTDRPGQPVQAKHLLSHIRPEPRDPLYAHEWPGDLPQTFSQPLNAPGRPKCHTDFMVSHDGLTGHIPPDVWRWKRRHDYYLNCMQDVDRNLVQLLDELDVLGLGSNTIIVMTSDHGDLDGAHQLHAKGATSYREQNQVPLVIAHPAYHGNQRCKAVTTHVDLAPTLVALTHATPEKKAQIVKGLPGRDLSSLLAQPTQANIDSARDGALFCYNMFAYLDGDFMKRVVALLGQPDGKAKLQAAAKEGLRPDMRKRGAIRSVFDGRYQFTRYFSPKQHNQPRSIEDIFRLNDVELFDLEADPWETVNLAGDRKKNGDLLEHMNGKLNRLIADEVGEDVGQMLPGGVDAGWVATSAVDDV